MTKVDKVKCTLVQALRLCTGRTDHRGSRVIAVPFHDHGTRGVCGQRHAPAALYSGKNPVPIVQEAGWDPGPIWTSAENLATTGIRSPDRPTHGQSLYRLSYPAHNRPQRTKENNLAYTFQSRTVYHESNQFRYTVELHSTGSWLSGRRLSGLPIIWIGSALRVNLSRILQN